MDAPQVFVDLDGKVETQYVYSDRAAEMAVQIVGIRSVYRRQGETLEDLDAEAVARCILSDLGLEFEYPLYYAAEGSVDYANAQKQSAFIRDTDKLFIARPKVKGYPLAAGGRFMHNGTIYTCGFIAVVLDERNNLVYLNLYNVIEESKDAGKETPCISWQTALEHFLREKTDFSFETFQARRTSSIESGRMTVESISPAMLYTDKTGAITPVWEIEGRIEFDQILPDGTKNHACIYRSYFVNALTGEYLCIDP